jgi:hypothetical protein
MNVLVLLLLFETSDRSAHSSYELPTHSRILSEELTVPHPVKKFLSFYGTQKFITAFSSTYHLPTS